METFADAGLTNPQLEQLNMMCHMYLQVTTLAEITDHTGMQLLPQALNHTNLEAPDGLASISNSRSNGQLSTNPH